MKRNITDLLDHYPAKDIPLTSCDLLSSERVKELTMKKINVTKKKARLGMRLLVAAAIISLLAVSALAAESIWGAGDYFRQVLNLRLEQRQEEAAQAGVDLHIQETVSQKQVEIINQLGKSFEPTTQTSEGTTITLKAAYAEQVQLHLYMEVTAPEGTVLPDDIIYEIFDPNSEEPLYYDADGEPGFGPLEVPRARRNADGSYAENPDGSFSGYRSAGYSYDIEPMPDDDPGDNYKEFHLVLSGMAGDEMKFNDGIPKTLHISIYEQVVNMNGDEDGYVPLAPGKFAFDVGIASEVAVVELDVAGLSYGGHKTRTWTRDGEEFSMSYDYTVEPLRLNISATTMEYEANYTCSDPDVLLGMAFQVVMKDGTTASMHELAGFGGTESWCYGTRAFDVPIDLGDVDYILIGDPELDSTHKVYLPESY